MRIDFSRLVRYEAIENGQRWIVGAGDSRDGQSGIAIGILALKHSGGYEIVLHLDNGEIDTFGPHQLRPDIQIAAPANDGEP